MANPLLAYGIVGLENLAILTMTSSYALALQAKLRLDTMLVLLGMLIVLVTVALRRMSGGARRLTVSAGSVRPVSVRVSTCPTVSKAPRPTICINLVTNQTG